MPNIDATDFDDPTTIGIDESWDIGPDGLIVKKLTIPESTTSGTGVYTPFLRQNANGGSLASQGFNTDDNASTAPNNSAGLDMSNAGTQAIRLRDVPIVYIGGVAYYEFRLDINEENNSGTDPGGSPNRNLELSELQIYTSSRQAVIGDYNSSSFQTRALGADDSGPFNLVYDLDGNGDTSVILRDTNPGSGADDFIFYVPVTTFAGASPDSYITLFSQFGPNPAEGATFEEWRIQTPSSISGVKFSDINGDGVRDLDGLDNIAGTSDDEVGLGGFTLYIDANNNNMLDIGEVSTVSAADGSFTFYGVLGSETGTTYVIREALSGAQVGNYLLTTGTNGGDHVVNVTVPGNYGVLVGNMPIIKDFTLDKSVVSVVDGPDAGGGGLANGAGDTINYLVSITNTGNVALTNVIIGDLLEGGIVLMLTQASNGDGDAIFDVGETWTYTASYVLTQADLDTQGGGDGVIRNVAAATAEYNGEVIGPRSDFVTTPLVYDPRLVVTKDVVSVTGGAGGLADSAGDVINYAISLANTGNITLTGITATDQVEAYGVTNAVLVSGDTDNDGELDVGETWNYTASYTVTQADLDNRGGGDGDLDNVAVGDSEQTPSDDDDAVVGLVYRPGIDLEKLVSVDGGLTYDDADSANGLLNANVGAPVHFRIIVENTGNISLTNVVISDVNRTNGSPGVPIDLSAYVISESISANGVLDVGEVWTLNYTQAFDPGVHLNTATVTTTQGVGDTDDAYYYSLITMGPGVGTPGFWGKLGSQFWDGIAGNETKIGPNFPVGDLLVKGGTDGTKDSNGDGVINASDKGLLIGDFNMNGITDASEDTIFIGFDDARNLINASLRTGNNADGVQILGRDLVATWLNYLAGNGIGDSATDAHSPEHFIEDAIDWLQSWGGRNGNGAQNNLSDNVRNETFDIYDAGHTAVRTSNAIWSAPQFAGDSHSASQMHDALDYYNNTGQTALGGAFYAHDRDDPLLASALRIAETHSTVPVSHLLGVMDVYIEKVPDVPVI
jgi:uncharacterized repeat protein (TIGR01451 family)